MAKKRKKGSGTVAGRFLGTASGGSKPKAKRTDTKNMTNNSGPLGGVRFKRKQKRGS